MTFGLSQKTIDAINAVFRRCKNVEKVVIYGSRAKGTAKNGSDIDLVLEGTGLDLALVNRLRTELDDLMLPWSIDLSIMEQIDNADLVDHIRRVGAVFYSKSDIGSQT